MNADDDRGFNLLSARWLALGAAAGVALSLALAQSGIQGPWQGIALVLALLALFATTTMALTAGKHANLLTVLYSSINLCSARKCPVSG